MAEPSDGQRQAEAHLAGIVELMQALEEATENGEAHYDDEIQDEDIIRQRIAGYPLSCEMRSGWTAYGCKMVAEEYMILLCTGGPAVRIRGELDQYHRPQSARLEYQDWFTPWAEHTGVSREDQRYLRRFAEYFSWE